VGLRRSSFGALGTLGALGALLTLAALAACSAFGADEPAPADPDAAAASDGGAGDVRASETGASDGGACPANAFCDGFDEGTANPRTSWMPRQSAGDLDIDRASPFAGAGALLTSTTGAGHAYLSRPLRTDWSTTPSNFTATVRFSLQVVRPTTGYVGGPRLYVERAGKASSIGLAIGPAVIALEHFSQEVSGGGHDVIQYVAGRWYRIELRIVASPAPTFGTVNVSVDGASKGGYDLGVPIADRDNPELRFGISAASVQGKILLDELELLAE
jgi:hypothetical protein